MLPARKKAQIPSRLNKTGLLLFACGLALHGEATCERYPPPTSAWHCEPIRAEDTALLHYFLPSTEPRIYTWLRQFFNQFSPTVAPFARSVALLVGVGDYDHLPKLPFVSNDIRRFLSYLTTQEHFDAVYVVLDKDADAHKVDNLMFNYFSQPENVGTADRFLFYYSGHGDPYNTGVGNLIFSSATGRFNAATALPVTRSIAWATALKARHALFVLDGCATGLGFGPKMPPRNSGWLKSPSRVVYTATRASEPTYGQNSSFFTDELLKVLQDGSADFTHDGLMDIDGVANIVERRMNEQFGSEVKRPVHLSGDGTFIFVNPKLKDKSDFRAANAETLVAALKKGAAEATAPETPDQPLLSGLYLVNDAHGGDPVDADLVKLTEGVRGNTGPSRPQSIDEVAKLCVSRDLPAGYLLTWADVSRFCGRTAHK